MELRQCELVIALHEERHFGRASARVGLSQPAFTQAIARLERELGTRLFDRSSRMVEPTIAGVALLPRARLLLAERDEAVRTVQRAARGEEGLVRIGAVGSAFLRVVPELVRSIRERRPGLTIEVTELLGAEQLDRLRRGLLDLGIAHVPEDLAPAGMDALTMTSDRLHIAVASDHPLASRTTARLAELAGQPLVVLRREDEADTQHIYLGACRAAGIEPPRLVEVTSLQGLLGQVAAGVGWGFVVDEVPQAWRRPDLTFLRVVDQMPTLPTSLVWPRDGLTPVARAVVDLLRTPRDD